MEKAKTLFFISPRRVEIRETPLPRLKEDEALVETVFSAVSAGTEMLVYRGQFPPLKDARDAVSGNLKYPLEYGYACVGRVKEIGGRVDRSLRGKLVFAFHSHASSFIIQPSSLLHIPEFISPESACFLPNMETAVNLVQDGAPLLGERVLVLGQGVVGLLTASLLNEFPLESLVAVDGFELRRKALEIDGQKPKVKSIPQYDLRPSAFDPFDLTFELTGSPSALNDAIEQTAFSGRIVIGSWYGEKRAEINLGGKFHRSRIKLIASQVSAISPELSGRWDKSRRFDVAWKALERIKPAKWITHRFPIEEADKAYRLLDENPQDTIQVIFDYSI
ncbi:MAG: zinc-binding alcohol dehydrogenase [Chloroflexi bacterium]|nr:zinc-binding alcohol dehydrogenase [Chloroflexota bacterium]MCA2003071.1 zinc-binding alcohol dehydrogenase [Chloroflexota bacterium]